MTRLRVDQYGARWNIAERLLHDAHGLFHLLHAYEEAIHIVPPCSDRHLKRKPVVDGVRTILPDVIVRTCGTKEGSRDSISDSVFRRNHARSRHAVHENTITCEKRVRLG